MPEHGVPYQYGIAPERALVDPFIVRYDGRDADRHVLDATALGPSLAGGGRLYIAVAHYCFFGDVPGRNFPRRFVCYAQPARPGSWDQFFYLVPLAGTYALHSELFNQAFGFIFGHVAEAIKKVWTKPDEKMVVIEKLADALVDRAKSDAEMAQQLTALLGDQHRQTVDLAQHQGDQLARIAHRLIDTIPQVSEATRPAAVDFVKPIGRTCRSITPFYETAHATEIGPSEAQAIKGGPGTSVSDLQTYRIVRIHGLNVVTGSCQLEIDGMEGTVRGRITDPALELPGNPYSKALDAHAALSVDAKAVVKAGALQSLFISNTHTSD